MRLTLDPMPALRLAREEAVNAAFNATARENLHRDQAHAAKRAEAAGIVGGATPSAEFAAEAELRKVTPLALAQTVLSKPNSAAQRELQRQRIMAAIAAAATPAALDQVSATPADLKRS